MKFVELNRGFIPFKEDEDFNPDFGLFWGKKFGGWLDWSDLLKKPRVVLLFEASSGKTEAFLLQNEVLRAKGRISFFVRIEDLAVEDLAVEGLDGTLDSSSFELLSIWEGL